MMRARPALALLSAALLSAVAALPVAAPAKAAQTDLRPFSAHYLAQWKDINVGTSDLTLVRGADAQHYVYTWRISARGIFHLFYSHDVVQTSWFHLDEGTVRPDVYEAEDGSSRMRLEFDWHGRRLTGQVAGKPVDLALEPDTQDLMSIQIQVMEDLRAGHLPGKFWIVDKDKIKDFEYRDLGPARIRTELGELDTVAVSSRRPDGDRVLTMWFAPSLGYLPVQAVRTRAGKLEFAMRIQRIAH